MGGSDSFVFVCSHMLFSSEKICFFSQAIDFWIFGHISGYLCWLISGKIKTK